MTRRALPFALTAILLAAPLAGPLGAQVGHTPENSPYEDLRGKQALTFGIGSIAPGGDPAGVGPRTGMQLNVRYELLMKGPLWLQTRFAYAPQLERTVKDPIATGPARNDGISRRPHAILEAGFGLNLTGNKSWHRIVPQLHGGLGWATGGTAKYDVGGYRFGNKFTLSYGLGARLVTGREWEGHVDVTHLFWKYGYPEDYRGNGSPTDNSILGDQPLGPWKGNLLLSVGMTRYFFR